MEENKIINDATPENGGEPHTSHHHHEDSEHHHSSGSHHHEGSEYHHSSSSHHHSSSSRHHSSSSHHKSRHKRHKHHSSGRKSPKTVPIWVMVVCLLATIAVFSAAFLSDYLSDHTDEQQLSVPDVELTVTVNNGGGVLVCNAVQQYLAVDMLNPQNAKITPYTFYQGERIDGEVPVSLKMSVANSTASYYKIELADNVDFKDAKEDMIDGKSSTYTFRHLFVNSDYYFRVTAYTPDGIVVSTGHFQTANTPRILTIDGISNVRDIGNWRTDSGKRIRQGLLYRGTALDGADEQLYHLTNEGMIDMLTNLGIKTDMDLRGKSSTTMDALGSRVNHKYYGMVMYEDIFTDNGKDMVRAIFTELANPDNYPIYIHCTYGRDRAGTICYLLEAVLGVSQGDCIKEYGLSNVQPENILIVQNGLINNYQGSSLKEKAENYLISCGINEYQIESIRKIFLED